VELNRAVAAAYGWTFDLGHGSSETTQARFTISPQGRSKVPDLLLALNHERYPAEQRETRGGEHQGPKRKRKPPTEWLAAGESVNSADRPVILRDTPDAKWRLLELVLRAESYAGSPRQEWPEIILVGDGFDAATLATARALAAAYEVTIRYAGSLVSSPRSSTESASAPTPRDETPAIDAMASFFAKEQRRAFSIEGKLRWSARRRRAFAYVRQFGRFDGDEGFWRSHLSHPESLRLSSGENRIQFRLRSKRDFESFEANIGSLAHVAWVGAPASATEDPE
jgi:hypothetical protein